MTRYSLFIGTPIEATSGGTLAGWTATIGLDAERESVKWSTILPGGYGALDVQLITHGRPARGFIPGESRIPLFGHVQLTCGPFLCFEGRITKRHRSGAMGGVVDAFHAEGYGIQALTDGFYQSSDTTTNVTSGQQLKAILAQQAPLIHPGADGVDFVDPGVAHHPHDYDGYELTQIVDQITKEGSGSLNAIFDWYAYEGRRARLIPRLPPDTADWLIDFDEDVTDWTEDASSAVSSVVCRYTAIGSTSATLTGVNANFETDFIARYGFKRSKLIEGGTIPAAQATALRDSYAGLHKSPEVQATVRREGRRGMELPGGGSLPAYSVRAGQWVQIGDPKVTGFGPQIVLKTEHDGYTNTFSLGFFPKDIRQQVLNLIRAMRYVAASRNPVSGARPGTG